MFDVNFEGGVSGNGLKMPKFKMLKSLCLIQSNRLNFCCAEKLFNFGHSDHGDVGRCCAWCWLLEVR